MKEMFFMVRFAYSQQKTGFIAKTNQLCFNTDEHPHLLLPSTAAWHHVCLRVWVCE